MSLFQVILEIGGLAPGGLNFDCKVRRESTALEDMFISHIGEHNNSILHEVISTCNTVNSLGYCNL